MSQPIKFEITGKLQKLEVTPGIQNKEEFRMVQDAKEIVMSYIQAMGATDYAAARNYLGDNVRVKGPAGEAFRSPDEFLTMMECSVKQNLQRLTQTIVAHHRSGARSLVSIAAWQ